MEIEKVIPLSKAYARKPNWREHTYVAVTSYDVEPCGLLLPKTVGFLIQYRFQQALFEVLYLDRFYDIYKIMLNGLKVAPYKYYESYLETQPFTIVAYDRHIDCCGVGVAFREWINGKE